MHFLWILFLVKTFMVVVMFDPVDRVITLVPGCVRKISVGCIQNGHMDFLPPYA